MSGGPWEQFASPARSAPQVDSQSADATPGPWEQFATTEPIAPPVMDDETFRVELQSRFDKGATADDLQAFAKSSGHAAIDADQLSRAYDTKARGGAVAFTPNQKAPEQVRAVPKTDATGAAMYALGDAVTLGYLDEAGAAIDTLIPGQGKPTVWDGEGWSDAYAHNLDDNRALQAQASEDHPIASTVGSIAGAFVPGANVLRGVKAAGAVGRLAKAGATGAIMGGVYGSGSADGDMSDRLVGAGVGAATGAIGGAGMSALAPVATRVGGSALDRLAPKLAQARFAKGQATNPHASIDAGIAQEVRRIVESVPTTDASGRALPKGQRSSIINGRIGELERSIFDPSDLSALGLRPSEALRFKLAWIQRHTLPEHAVEALRGSQAGDATADAIRSARRLRTLVPEEAPATMGPAGPVAVGADAAATAIGSALGGPGGAVASRLFLSRALAKLTGNGGPSSRAAEALAAQAPRYAALPPGIGNSTMARNALSKLAGDARDVRHLAREATIADRARKAAEEAGLMADASRLGTLNARDNVSAAGGWRGHLEDVTGLTPDQQDVGMMMMLNRGQITPAQLKLHLSDPLKLQAGNAGNHITDRLVTMADGGQLTRKPGWVPPSMRSTATPAPSATGEPIRNPIAYRATAEGNQSRTTAAVETARSHPDLSDAARSTVSRAVTEIGSTGSRTKAEGAMSSALEALEPSERSVAEGILKPLIVQKARKPRQPKRKNA